MSIYAIGDIQGCYDDLLRLLDHIQFSETSDQLWFAGDLVNRGPKSLDTLRFVKSLGNSAITVLGNHDLHLLALPFHQDKIAKHKDLQAVLKADDAEELLYWLRHRPLFYQYKHYGLLHAGLPPQWSLTTAAQMARLAESVLQSDESADFFKSMYGNQPDLWNDNLQGHDLIRFIINCFTRMRYCDEQGRLDLVHAGPIGSQPEHLYPWFALPQRQSQNQTLIFGHWSTLGYYHGYDCYAIDSGCLWGGPLTAIKIEEPVEVIQIPCQAKKRPGNQ